MSRTGQTTAAAFPKHLAGEVIHESIDLRWDGIYARRYRFPRIVDRFLVPATPEPLISCTLSGHATFHERDLGQAWTSRSLDPGDLFVTHSHEPYEVQFSSPKGNELEVIQIHLATPVITQAIASTYPDSNDSFEIVDFFGRDPALSYLCFACSALLEEQTTGSSVRVAGLTDLIAKFLAEKYVQTSGHKSLKHGGLPIHKLRVVENFVRLHLAENISIDSLAELAALSPFHFARAFKESTGQTPLQFITRERIIRAQQLLRETAHSIIDISLEVGYSSPGHFAKVFRRLTGSSPNQFRNRE